MEDEEGVRKKQALFQTQRVRMLLDQGLVECQICKRTGPVQEAFTVGYQNSLVFGACPDCLMQSEVVLRGTDKGIEVTGRSRAGIILSS